MKKIFTYLLALATVTTVVSCDDKDDPEPIIDPIEPVAGPTITWASNPDFKKMDITEEMDVKIQVEAPAGIKTFKIAVKSEVLNDMGITEIDLIEPGENVKQYMDMILGGAGNPMDKTSYLLDLSKLVPMLNNLTNAESDHTFTVTVADKNDSTAMRTAVFHQKLDRDKDKEMNAALKVNMFTEFNVKSIDFDSKMVTFYNELTNTVPDDPKTAYFTYTELKEKGLTNSDEGAILKDAEGKKYRLPTHGELQLLAPHGSNIVQWNDDRESTALMTETIYLKNDSDGVSDQTTEPNETDGEYCISGNSWLKRGETIESVNLPNFSATETFYLAPVYGLRFQGTSQYAAYRWEYCKIDNNTEDRYLSIKIKALGKDDKTTTIDDVAKESFWTDGYIEFKFPASGMYNNSSSANNPSPDNIRHSRVGGYCWSSSLKTKGKSQVYTLYFTPNGGGTYNYFNSNRYSLRLVKVEE